VLVVTVACAVVGGSLAARSPKAVRTSIAKAARAQKSVHWTGKYVTGAGATTTYVTDVNASSGLERITVPACYASAPRGSVRLRLVHGTEYVKGNVCGLRYALKLSQTRAKKYVGKWISVPRRGKGHMRFRWLAAGMTLGSVVREITVWPASLKLHLSTQRSNGKRRLVVQGTWGDPKTAWELRARAGHKPLPVAFSTGLPTNGVQTHFSRWNKPVHVHAPARSTPIATVRG
jgi:hypothetical protein